MFATPFLPETTPNDMRGVMALLALIGTPESKAAQDLLAKLSAEKDAAVEAAQKSAADRAEAEKAHAAAKRLHNDVRGRLTDLTAAAEARHSAQADRDAALADREAKIGAMAREIEQASSAHLDRVASDTNALAAREQRIADREKDIEARETKLAAGEADYAGRISKLKALAG